MAWRELCQSEEYRGCWVALDNVRYDPVTSHPIEGEIVDADEDLADLCARMRSSDRTACAILHCEDDDSYTPLSTRPAWPPSRAAQQ
jgi:hypothetical protein